MIFSNKARAQWPRAIAALAVFAIASVAGCGGGTSQFEPFVAKRMFAFGDDASALTASGRKYSVNGLATDGAIDCKLNPLWVQSVAALYGFGFAECSLDPAAIPKAKTFALAGAMVTDVTAQVESQVAAGGFREGDIATLLAGTNDILALYQQYPARAESELMNDARSRGVQLAQIVNRLVGLGVKVIVSDLPDVGLTPFARAQKAMFTDIDRAALMSRMTSAFNEQLGVNVVLDGRFVGLVQAQLRFQVINVSPASFGFVNITDGVCTVAVLNCTTSTLLTDAVLSQYLWADETNLSPAGQAQLAGLAIDRAQRNPF